MASNGTSEMSPTSVRCCDQKEEVSLIKAAFPNRCRVVSDLGEFQNVVTVQPENMDVTIKFQLSAAYPSVVPEIVIRSESMSEENVCDMKEVLKSKAKKLVGQYMIQALISEAEVQLKSLGLKPGKVIKTNNYANVDKNQKKKKQKIKKKPEDEEKDKKLPSMKTADDVVKRIIWDGSLNREDFIVGYFDRFRGLVEKHFSDFSWENLASVDYDVLAIPKHRIQYFKYKNIKVWDKPRRIDNIFGSADGTKTIDVVMKEVEEMESSRREGLGTDEGNDGNFKSEEESSDEDSDSDDGIEVTIGNSACAYSSVIASSDTSGKKTRFSSHEHGNKSSEEDEGRASYRASKIHRDEKPRPNHFICVRITNEEILDKIVNVQDDFMNKEAVFSECCIPGSALHVTLCTLGLDTPEQLTHCINVLKKVKPLLKSALPASSLKLQGVSNFYNQVIYAQVQHEQDFLEFHKLLKKSLEEDGIEIRDGYNYVPHMTILKLSRPVTRLRGSRNIEPELYKEHTETSFGSQAFDSIHLCSMGKERRSDGFYLTPLELCFSDS